MKPAAFEYHRPRSIEETLELLARHGEDAKLLAGGQSLIPTMNFRLAQPAVLIDLERVAELNYVRGDGSGALCLGAMTRQRAAERSPQVAERVPLLAEALPHIAHPQIRNRGTVGGSLAHADPAGELPAIAVALDADLLIRGPRGDRIVPAGDFFTGLFATALEPDELLAEARLPFRDGRGWAFGEFARRHGDYALAGAAMAVSLNAEAVCREARIVLLGVADRPIRAAVAEAVLVGSEPADAAIREAACAAAAGLEPPSDVNASAAYRRRLVEVLVRRLLPRAFERARRGGAAS